MAKRLTAEQRRKQILNKAIHVFAQNTYHGATTKGIAEEAGITEGLIYRYFGSKRNLFLEAIRVTTADLVDGLDSNLQIHKDNPLVAISEAFSYYVKMLQGNGDLAKMIFLVIAELDQDDVRKAYLPHQKDALKKFARALEYWQSQGYMVSSFLDTYTATWLVYGTYLLLALVKHSHGGTHLDPSPAIRLAVPFFKPTFVKKWAAELDEHSIHLSPLVKRLATSDLPEMPHVSTLK